MDYALQVHEAKYVFPIPDGLKELSSDIIREVLRHQPEHINGFIADYLETMLIVRENARDAGVVVCDVMRQGFFFDELFRLKNVNREQANAYAVIIQAAWRGYVIRKKVAEYLKKKKKFEEEKEMRKSIRIEELLAGLGITYHEATRAAEVIQAAYKESKRGKWVTTETGEVWVGESVPFGQRIREEDRIRGRFARWEKEDFGEFFEMDESGAIRYDWPRVGQLRKVPRNTVPEDIPVVEFFAMRDLQGHEQYTYLIKSKAGMEKRGVPIGFLVPVPRSLVGDEVSEVEFKNPDDKFRMGNYTYIFRDDVDKPELEKFDEVLRAHTNAAIFPELIHEDFDYDPFWVLPRLLIRIRQKYLLDTDSEVKFKSLPERIVCEETQYTFRAETIEQTAKIIRNILKYECLTVEEGLAGAGHALPYREQLTGRIIPVDTFTKPSFIQKINIQPESTTGEEESNNLLHYEYVFVPSYMQPSKKIPGAEPTMTIPIVRFQGYHSDYKGSVGLQDKVFVLGPLIKTPDGKPFTYDSLFWDEFGSEAWNQLLYDFFCTGHEDEIGEEEAESVGYEEIHEDIGEQDGLGKETEEEQAQSSEFEQTDTEPVQIKQEVDTIQHPPATPQTDILEKGEGEGRLIESRQGEIEPEPEKPEEKKIKEEPKSPEEEKPEEKKIKEEPKFHEEKPEERKIKEEPKSPEEEKPEEKKIKEEPNPQEGEKPEEKKIKEEPTPKEEET